MKIQFAIEEVINNRIVGLKYKYLLKWDLEMERLWNVRIRADHCLKGIKTEIMETRWQTPPLGWVKFNFDGASRGYSGVNGIGAMIKNVKGELLEGIAKHLGFSSNNVAEIVTLEAGLNWCVSNN